MPSEEEHYSKVVWSRGMPVLPQHFQQDMRYIEHLIASRCKSITPYDWGVADLKLNIQSGKVGLHRCSGRFIEGTPFIIDSGNTPTPIDIPALTEPTIVYLCLPEPKRSQIDIDSTNTPGGLHRFSVKQLDVRDNVRVNADHSKGQSEERTINIGTLHFRLALGHENLTQYQCIGIARIIEKESDGNLIIDSNYIPACLRIRYEPDSHLLLEIKTLQNSMERRAEKLASRIRDSGLVAEFETSFYLQTINRYLPLLVHLWQTQDCHPETFYRLCLQLIGDLTTITHPTRRPFVIQHEGTSTTHYPTYQHEKLAETFAAVLEILQECMKINIGKSAAQIQIDKQKLGFHIALIEDKTWLKDREFYLAAKMPNTDLVSELNIRTRIGTTTNIHELARKPHFEDIRRHNTVRPREIPDHKDYVYFKFDKSCPMWQELHNSKGFGFHFYHTLEDIELQLWAIKE